MSKPATTDTLTTLHIAIATSDSALRDLFLRVLPGLGHGVHSTAADGPQLVENCRLKPPDLLLLEEGLPGQDVSEVLSKVRAFAALPTILIAEGLPAAVTEKVAALAISSYLKRPITASDLSCAIAVARRGFEQMESLRREAAELRQALQDRKIIERAKEAVARRMSMPESDAYLLMRRAASNENRKLIDVACRLLGAEDVFRALDSPPAGG